MRFSLRALRYVVETADAGSVTEAASRLYLTQPAVSAALRRLTSVVGAPLFGLLDFATAVICASAVSSNDSVIWSG